MRIECKIFKYWRCWGFGVVFLTQWLKYNEALAFDYFEVCRHDSLTQRENILLSLQKFFLNKNVDIAFHFQLTTNTWEFLNLLNFIIFKYSIQGYNEI